jgi:hypothetical protein
VTKGLTVEEDAELRRLAALKAFGELTAVAADSFADLRARDRREDIREPQDVVIPRPAKPVSDGPVVH